MKTTLDLPADLVRQLKLRAVHDGKKLKDVAAEVLRAGLASKRSKRAQAPAKIIVDKKTGLPIIQGKRKPRPGEEMTPERIAEILIAQEVEWAHGSGGR